MGRHPKPLAQLQKDGTFRGDRHAERLLAPHLRGKPRKPAGMSKDAQDLWDWLVPQLTAAGVVTEPDSAALELMCFWWGRLKQLMRLKKQDYKSTQMASMANKAWQGYAVKFGLTPVDRTRIQVASGADQLNPLEQFLQDQPDEPSLSVVS